ncbi:MAG: isoleucyl-tRNA synthetase, partial [Candidatus Berkelbacteria bacterium Athens1014_28]
SGARDWSISRQRYWASVIPIWVCDGEAKIKNQKSKINPSRSARAEAEITNQNEKICNHKVVVGSVKELEELSGQKINDLHKHTVDKIIFNCDKCGGIMKRIPDVLDTWFDSGSMPYAQMHYPFENKGKFENNFPAEYIAEGIDQTRSWFYYLHVLSTAVMAKPAFKNVIVNGIILAEDGKKMAKRLKNYPDPMEMLDKYGADVMRIYLSSSPVMLAENLNFSESDLSEYSTGMLRMLWNSYCFFMLYVNCEDLSVGNFRKEDIKNILDLWILSKIEKLNQDVESSLLKYNIPSATRLFKVFIGEMSNWYIRRSRKRFWKSEDKNDMISAQRTLHYLLVKLSILFAPFAPFISEKIYKNLTGKESVHLADFPVTNKELIDDEIENQMERARKIVEIGLAKRAKAKIKIRQPLSSLSYSGKKLSDDLEQIIADEINVKEVKNSDHSDEVFLDTNLTKDLIAEGSARDIIRAIQDLRKEAGLIVSDEIVVFYQTSGKIQNTIVKFSEFIKKETLAKSISKENLVDCQNSKLLEIQKEKIVIAIKKK